MNAEKKDHLDSRIPYSPLSIANYFINKAQKESSSLTPMKLVKLIYVAYGWYLALYDEQLINEPIQAWKYGPVVETVYHEFKHYGNNPITKSVIDVYYDEYGNFIKKDYEIGEKDTNVCEFLDRIWEVYKHYSGIQLSNWTHYEGSPWFKTWYEHGGSDKKSYPISNELIKSYFLQMADSDGKRVNGQKR